MLAERLTYISVGGSICGSYVRGLILPAVCKPLGIVWERIILSL